MDRVRREGNVARRLGDIRTVADILMCDPRTVSRRADDGSMPPGVKIGALRRWDLDELDAWIAGGCKPLSSSARGDVHDERGRLSRE